MKKLVIVFSKLYDMVKRGTFVFGIFMCNIVLFGFMCTYFYTNAAASLTELHAELLYIENPEHEPVVTEHALLDTYETRYFRYGANGRDIVILTDEELESGVIPDRIRISLPGDLDESEKNDYKQQILQLYADEHYMISSTSLGVNEAAKLMRMLLYIAILFILSGGAPLPPHRERHTI